MLTKMPMLSEFDFSPVTELPRHHTFLQALVPSLAALEQTEAIWLSGSLARGDADRWSSVDLCLQWRDAAPDSACDASPYNALLNSLDKALGAGNTYFAQGKESMSGGSLSGICLGAQTPADLPCKCETAGVFFEICWAASSVAWEMETGTHLSTISMWPNTWLAICKAIYWQERSR